MHQIIDTNIFNIKRGTNGCQYPGASYPSFCLKLNKYLYWHGSYTEDEMQWFDKIEKDWKDGAVDYTFMQLIEIFPEAKSVAKKYITEEIENCKADLKEADNIEKEVDDLIYRKASKESEFFWKCITEGLLLDPLRVGREQKIKRNTFYLSALKPGGKEVGNGVTQNDIDRAKAYPIDQILKVRRDGTTRCVWCNDKDGDDLHYYRKGNSVWCFGCSKGGDAIDVYMQVTGVKFLEAVKKLR